MALSFRVLWIRLAAVPIGARYQDHQGVAVIVTACFEFHGIVRHLLAIQKGHHLKLSTSRRGVRQELRRENREIETSPSIR